MCLCIPDAGSYTRGSGKACSTGIVVVGPSVQRQPKGGVAPESTCKVGGSENINAGETKVDHRPDGMVWQSPTKRRKNPRMGVREVVCCFQLVLLSNSGDLNGTVSCQAGQANLLDQTVGISCVTLSLPLSFFSTFQ